MDRRIALLIVFNCMYMSASEVTDLCEKQLRVLSNSSLGTRLANINSNFPMQINPNNEVQNYLADYHNCMLLEETIDNTQVRGKYCQVAAVMPRKVRIYVPGNFTYLKYDEYEKKREKLKTYYNKGCLMNQTVDEWISKRNSLTVKAGICIPNACNTTEALEYVLYGRRDYFMYGDEVYSTTKFEELSCRLPNDKPFTSGDIAATVIVIIIVISVLTCTACDIFGRKTNKHRLVLALSMNTNLRRLMDNRPKKGAIECLDGIRAISMLWIFLFHTFFYICINSTSTMLPETQLPINAYLLPSAIYAVDTFLVLSGALVVYSTIKKSTRKQFLQKLHLFYVNRLFRLYPSICAVVLIYATFWKHLGDGPQWSSFNIDSCKTQWWTVLLFVQNVVYYCEIPMNGVQCLSHIWYISMDMQLHIISPLVLVWLFGSKKIAWTALTLFVLLSVAISTVFSFMLDLPFTITLSDIPIHAMLTYVRIYYLNPLVRCSPFFFGMFLGYALHRTKPKPHLNQIFVWCIWLLSLAVLVFGIVITKYLDDPNIELQLLNNILNAFYRSIWALAISWIIFASHNGYGGPINWLLSLNMWKLISRVSYTMYLIQLPLIDYFIGIDTNEVQEISAFYTCTKFVFNVFVTLIAAILLTIFVEMPFSNLQPIVLGQNKVRLIVETNGKCENDATKVGVESRL